MRRGRPAGEEVVFDEPVPIGRKDELDVQALAFGIALGLFEAVSGRKFLPFGFDERESHGLGVHVDTDAEDVVHLAPRAPPRLVADDVDRARRLFAFDQVLRPADLVECGIDQLGACVRLVQAHG